MEHDSTRKEIYSRMLALRDFSEDDLRAIEGTTITVVGAGGLGSPALRLLTALGFGKIRIIDHDIVELSNLQRQTIYTYADIGLPKVEAAVTNLAKYNPFVEFEPIGMSINKDNALELIEGSDILLDGLDSMSARRALNAASYSLKIPYIYAGAVEYYANLSTFIPDETGCLYCLIGDTEDNPENTCANIGVSPSLLSIVASIEVQEALHLSVGTMPKLAGKLMHVDVQNLGFDTFEIARSERCPICSKHDTSESHSSSSDGVSITKLCTNSFSISPIKKAEVNLDAIASQLEDEMRLIRRKTSLVVKSPSGLSITIMQTGGALVKGAKDDEEAKAFYERIVLSV
jgi:adenylyltransferase/sulfurtransferase